MYTYTVIRLEQFGNYKRPIKRIVCFRNDFVYDVDTIRNIVKCYDGGNYKIRRIQTGVTELSKDLYPLLQYDDKVLISLPCIPSGTMSNCYTKAIEVKTPIGRYYIKFDTTRIKGMYKNSDVIELIVNPPYEIEKIQMVSYPAYSSKCLEYESVKMTNGSIIYYYFNRTAVDLGDMYDELERNAILKYNDTKKLVNMLYGLDSPEYNSKPYLFLNMVDMTPFNINNINVDNSYKTIMNLVQLLDSNKFNVFSKSSINTYMECFCKGFKLLPAKNFNIIYDVELDLLYNIVIEGEIGCKKMYYDISNNDFLITNA